MNEKIVLSPALQGTAAIPPISDEAALLMAAGLVSHPWADDRTKIAALARRVIDMSAQMGVMRSQIAQLEQRLAARDPDTGGA